ncbi:NUDIX hydrolase [Nitratireductor basaltis]|uniref:NUDIX hydrolase n=1 Tax=Nitratireductor basaltis TaxID=472175 RepID=A0A084UC86_9HYPH|nr:NUDIX domain-containing protein [Nitratireductor basaltis]KFB10572.1 NUDIX hydrolase [Nitratireductor basaltis]
MLAMACDSRPNRIKEQALSEIAAVAVVAEKDGKFLLTRRMNPPYADQYGFPGGKVEPGETSGQAACRELLEETGIQGSAPQFICQIMVENVDGRPPFRLDVFRLTIFDGTLLAGSDAREAGWFSLEEMRQMPVIGSTLEIVEDLASTRGS